MNSETESTYLTTTFPRFVRTISLERCTAVPVLKHHAKNKYGRDKEELYVFLTRFSKREENQYHSTTRWMGPDTILSATHFIINIIIPCDVFVHTAATHAMHYNIEARSRNSSCGGKATSITYFSVCVCVCVCVQVRECGSVPACSLTQHSMRMRRITLSSAAPLPPPHFRDYLINDMIFVKKCYWT